MLTIRLKKMGSENRPVWRVVVTEARSSRNSRSLDELGFYHPTKNPPVIQIQKERYEDWIRKGAKPSPTVASLVRRGALLNRAD